MPMDMSRLRRRADAAGRPQCAERGLLLGGLSLARDPREDIAKGLETYPGLPHRQERVAALGKVIYVNDSKATNADAAARALVCTATSTGSSAARRRRAASTPLEPYFDRVRYAFLIGEATDCSPASSAGKLPFDAVATCSPR